MEIKFRRKTKKNLMKKGVYMILNKVNNKFYIGSTHVSFKSRFQSHKSDLRSKRHCNAHLQRAYDKYGEKNFSFLILEVVKDYEKILEREQDYLDYFKPYIRDIGYNILEKSNCSLGYKHDEETIKRIGLISKSRKPHPNSIEAMRKANIGKKRPKELLKKLREVRIRSVIQLTLNGVFVKKWDSITEAANFYNKEYGLKSNSNNISRVCSGRVKSAFGFLWVYNSEYDENKKYEYKPIINADKRWKKDI